MTFTRMSATLAIALTGCASNPYIENTRPVVPKLEVAPASPVIRGSLDYALAYVDATHDAYRAKLREDYDRQQLISGSLLSLAAAGIGAAVGHANSDVLIGMALGGGLIYQLGTWNSSQDRLVTNIEGMKAMSCLKAAVAPFRSTVNSAAMIATAQSNVVAGFDEMAAALSKLTQALHLASGSSSPNSETAQTARDEIAETATIVTQVRDLMQRTQVVQGRIGTIGAELEAAVQRVIDLVDQAQKTSNSQLNTLPQQIAGIFTFANVLAPGLNLSTAFNDRITAVNGQINPKAGTTENESDARGRKSGASRATVPLPPEPRELLATGIGQLRETRVKLGVRMSVLSGLIDRPLDAAINNMKGCGVDIAKLTHALQLGRNPVAIPAGQARTVVVDVQGASAPLMASLQDVTTGLSVTTAGGGSVVVTTDGKTAAGTYLAKVEDGTRTSTLLTIRIDAVAGAANTTSPAQLTCAGPRSTDRALMCLVQNIVQVSSTGEINSDTCKGIFDKKLSTTGELNDALRAKALEAKDESPNASDASLRKLLSKDELKSCKVAGAETTEGARGGRTAAQPANAGVAGAKTAYERTLGAGDVGVISEKLGMTPPVSVINDDFRRALADYQKRAKRPDTRGVLTQEDAKQVLNAPAAK